MSVSRARSPAFWFPFGLVSILVYSIIFMMMMLLENPANDPQVVKVIGYFRIMGTGGLIFIIITTLYSRKIDRTPIVDKMYNPIGIWVAFAMGLGFLAILRIFAPTANSFSNVDFDLASLPVGPEFFMFIVASTEEMFFRVAVPMFFYLATPSNEGVKWLSALVISSGVFAAWHWFAYNADEGLMLIAFVAGVMLFLGYQLGAKVGGGELAYLGVVAGHWLWNISSIGNVDAFMLVMIFLVGVTVVVIFISPRSASVARNYIWRLAGR